MAQKGNPINLAFDISTLKYNMKKKKKLQEEKDTSASMDKEEAKQKLIKGQIDIVIVNTTSPKDNNNKPICSSNSTGAIQNKEDNNKSINPSQVYYAKSLPNTDDTNINTLQLIIRNLEKELFDKKTEIRTLSKNFKEKITLTEVENKKLIDSIEDKYCVLLNNITDASDNKIKEIAMQFEANTTLLQKEHLKLLNEIRTIRSTHISIDDHREKMSELNETWENKYNALKKEYDAKYKQLLSKLNEGIESKVSMLKSNSNSIIINNNVNVNVNSTSINSPLQPEEMIRAISRVQLEHEIGYSNYVFELMGKYNEVYGQMKGKRKESIDVMKTFVIKKFNELMSLSDNHIKGGRIIDNKIKDKDKDRSKKDRDNKDKGKDIKINELVNYDSSRLQSSILLNNDKDESMIKYNEDVSQERSKINDNFTSEFESFNFNEDSLPNRNIQVLTPPDMID